MTGGWPTRSDLNSATASTEWCHTKPTTTLQWCAHWLPRRDKDWVDAPDTAGGGGIPADVAARLLQEGEPLQDPGRPGLAVGVETVRIASDQAQHPGAPSSAGRRAMTALRQARS
jgi:hypothetical protein